MGGSEGTDPASKRQKVAETVEFTEPWEGRFEFDAHTITLVSKEAENKRLKKGF